MATLHDGVRMVLCAIDSDQENGEFVWEFRTSNPLLKIIEQGFMHEWFVDEVASIGKSSNGHDIRLNNNKLYRVHIPYTSETRNQIFNTRDKAVEFVNDFIRRYK